MERIGRKTQEAVVSKEGAQARRVAMDGGKWAGGSGMGPGVEPAAAADGVHVGGN